MNAERNQIGYHQTQDSKPNPQRHVSSRPPSPSNRSLLILILLSLLGSTTARLRPLALQRLPGGLGRLRIPIRLDRRLAHKRQNPPALLILAQPMRILRAPLLQHLIRLLALAALIASA